MYHRTPGKSHAILSALAGLALIGSLVACQPAPAPTGAAAAPTRPGATNPARPTPPAASSRSVSVAQPTSHTPVAPTDGVVVLPLADFAAGKARFYTFRSGAKTIAFFVLKGSDGVIRSAFDACDVCYEAKKGYRQEGDYMVCNNCGNRFPSSRINVESGGCNPAPLKQQVQGDRVIIRGADLETGARFF